VCSAAILHFSVLLSLLSFYCVCVLPAAILTNKDVYKFSFKNVHKRLE